MKLSRPNEAQGLRLQGAGFGSNSESKDEDGRQDATFHDRTCAPCCNLGLYSKHCGLLELHEELESASVPDARFVVSQTAWVIRRSFPFSLCLAEFGLNLRHFKLYNPGTHTQRDSSHVINLVLMTNLEV